MVGLQRVDDLDGVTTRVISVQAPDVEDIVGNERCRQNLQVAIVSQRVTDEAATQLTLSQTATGRGDWEDNRNVFQTFQTQDFLNQVSGHGQVRAPGRRSDSQAVTVVDDLATDLAQASNDGLTRVINARNFAGAVDGKVNSRHGGNLTEQGATSVDSAAGDVSEQLAGQIQSRLDQSGVHAALETS